MARFMELKKGEKFVGESSIALSGGRTLVIEAAEGPNGSLITSRTIVGTENEHILTSQDCYCDGVYIGSKDCPGNRIDCNCVTKTVSCY